ncbi:hypothetical protein Ciccas_005157 [Cichlidogyrus casuarinus]|uniref:Uncharacterized protein n=1 Tax=Cichlidogyrus casuarinus TaxID=1844966 RepID=A0ABD2Q9G2_9PLAT
MQLKAVKAFRTTVDDLAEKQSIAAAIHQQRQAKLREQRGSIISTMSSQVSPPPVVPPVPKRPAPPQNPEEEEKKIRDFYRSPTIGSDDWPKQDTQGQYGNYSRTSSQDVSEASKGWFDERVAVAQAQASDDDDTVDGEVDPFAPVAGAISQVNSSAFFFDSDFATATAAPQENKSRPLLMHYDSKVAPEANAFDELCDFMQPERPKRMLHTDERRSSKPPAPPPPFSFD